MNYQTRIIDQLLDDIFPHVTAIALEGAKGVGKTATAAERSKSTLALDDPADLAALTANPGIITQLESPLLIDEWQLYPPVWDQVRRAVDTQTNHQFILTGSATVAPGTRIHSGAGRVLSFPMRPLSIAERGIETPTVSLAAILEQTQITPGGHSSITLAQYVDEIFASGFPGIRTLPERVRKSQIDGYVTRIIDHELPEAGVMVRRSNTLRRWLTAYAAATSSNASYTAILDAATAGESEKPARTTVQGYRDALMRLYVLDPLEAWSPTFAPLSRLTVAPKHHLVDPAISATLTGVSKANLLTGNNTTPWQPQAESWLGALFESLVVQSVRVYAAAAEARIGHLRTKNTEHEIDLIVERTDGGVVAIEVKVTPNITDRDVRHLNWLKGELGDRLLDRIVITSGPHAYRRSDGIAVIPLALLGP